MTKKATENKRHERSMKKRGFVHVKGWIREDDVEAFEKIVSRATDSEDT